MNNDSYIELLRQFPPRPIKSKDQFKATQDVVDRLIDKGELTQDEGDYLNLLGLLIHEYEKTNESTPDVYGIDFLKVLTKERGLRQKDLVPVFKTESIASDIFRNKRQLTTRHIKELSDFFNVSPAVFFPNQKSQTLL